MTKHPYRFGRTYFANFYKKHIVSAVDMNGVPLLLWKKAKGERDAQMWAFPIPQIQKAPELARIDTDLPEIEIKDIVAEEKEEEPNA